MGKRSDVGNVGDVAALTWNHPVPIEVRPGFTARRLPAGTWVTLWDKSGRTYADVTFTPFATRVTLQPGATLTVEQAIARAQIARALLGWEGL